MSKMSYSKDRTTLKILKAMNSVFSQMSVRYANEITVKGREGQADVGGTR